MADDQQKTKDTEAVEEKDIQTDEKSDKAEEAAAADENGKAVKADVEETEEVETEAAAETDASTDDDLASDAVSAEDTSSTPDETGDVVEETAEAEAEAVSASSDEDTDDAETESEAADEEPETVAEADDADDDGGVETDDDALDGEPVATDEDKDARPLLERAVDAAAAEMAVPRAEDAGVSVQEEAPLSSVSGAEGLQATGQVGYTGEIVGRVVTLEELERGDEEDEKAAATYDQLMKLVDESFTIVEEQEIVQGRVVSVGEKDVVIDIGFKSDGVVSLNEFDRELEAGDEVEVFVDRLEDYHGQLVLSKTKADKLRRWQRIEEAYDQSSIIEGTIVRRIKGGMIVELDIGGMEAFLPGSQIDVRPVRDFDAYLEKRMEFKIVKLNPANENIVVSHKALIEKELQAQREKILSTMEAGQILEGTVKNITDFGVFIDLGGVDGLLHITDLSWGRVSHPSELVDLDEKLNVVVLDYDKERQRISLGLKQLQPHPWEDINEKYDEGETVEGKVVSITDYGAFVELEKGIEGLVHISEMSWTEHIRHPSQMVSLGQLVNVKILNIDKEGKKISLGMKQLEPDPWTGISDRYPPGTVMRGKVRNITNFGVFVEIEPGIDGLVHISDLSWTKKIRHPSEMIKKGQDLDVVILNVDEEA
ncbi:MAG: 30S ribosomal protein S1, partial [Rhodothermales bacterium]